MATSSSQPIALPTTNDYIMADNFDPASYTRHFLGSPISWRASPKMSSSIDSDRGSIINAFNAFDREGELCRNYTCCGIHLNDLHALLEHFEDVHILVVDPKAPAQIHVPFNPQCVDPPQPTFDSSDDMEFDIDLDSSSSSLHSVPPTPAATSSRSSPSSAAPTPPRTPISSAYPSPTVAAPPSLAYLQPQSHYIQAPQFTQYQTTPSHTPYTSQPPSPGHPHPLGGFIQNHPNVVAHPEEAFNSYARFSSDYSSHLPGAQYNAASGDDQVVVPPEYTGAPTVVGEYPANQQQGYLGQPMGMQIPDAQGQQCIPPALLFGTINATAGEKKTRDGANRTSPQPLPSKVRLKIRALGDHATRSTPTTPTTISPSHTPGPSSTTTPAPNPATNQVQVATSSLLLSKPFRCPKPNCNKSYKQANGLKYHMTHGSCNFAPPKDLEHVKDLLERKRREREAREEENNGAGGSGRGGLSRSASVGSIGTKGAASPRTTDGSGSNPTDSYYTDLAGLGSITETELREVEREAEKRLRPFACGVGDCQRRYKNMNGLRYHYQVGLQIKNKT
jgi:transcription factor SFP1